MLTQAEYYLAYHIYLWLYLVRYFTLHNCTPNIGCKHITNDIKPKSSWYLCRISRCWVGYQRPFSHFPRPIITRVVNDNFFNYRDNYNDNGMRIIVIAITITRQLKIIAITINYRVIGDNDNFYKICEFWAKMEICSYIVLVLLLIYCKFSNAR